MYQVFLLPTVHSERRKLPGFMGQRIKNIISDLAQNPRPYNSIKMEFQLDSSWEPRRIRVDSWRIIYAIDDQLQQVAVLAIRQRPPYDYEDLTDLMT